jgi:ABC-type nitrate/sulfonate/bicarbonate transport system substrate-binding protein
MLEFLTKGVEFDWLENTEAAWTLLAFGLWNAPAEIRQDLTMPERTSRIRWLFRFVAFASTFTIFWVLFDRSGAGPPSAPPSALYMALPLGVAALVCVAIGVINHALLRPVSIRLLWRHQSQFSGIYVAKYFGIFAKHGLRVDIHPAIPNRVDSALDHFGGCHFAIVSSTDVVKARATGIKIRAIHVIVPEPAIAFLTRQESDIYSFADFKGKRISYRKGYEESDTLKMMLHSVGLAITDIESVIGLVDCEEFIDGTADVVAGHEAIEPMALAHQQIFVRRIQPILKGHPVFADTLVTAEQVISATPSVARGMACAIQEGWDSVAQSSGNGIDATLYLQKDYSASNRSFQREIQDAMIGLRGGTRILPGSLQPFGMREADWIPIIQGMEDAGIVQRGLRPTEMYWH